MILSETRVLAVTFTKQSDGSRLNLDTEVTAIEFQVKVAEGDADPPLIAKSLSGGIVKRTQSGATLGIADITIGSTDTTSSPWPAAPANIGAFRYDVVVVLTSGARHYAVAPTDFVVSAAVNPA